MSNLRIFIDFGSTFTKVVAFDTAREELVCRAQSPTTVETDVTIGLRNALEELRKQVPFTDEDVKNAVACSSAAGGLKMVCIGLVPEYTTKAGHLAALGAGAKVVGTYSYELSSAEIREIEGLNPDIILLTGGTDGGNRKIIAHNAVMLAGMDSAVRHVIAAGNKSARDDIEAAFEGKGKNLYFVKNVMPEFGRLELDDVNAKIREIFISRITEAKGIKRAGEMISAVLMPTPSAVLEAAQLICAGGPEEPGLGELLVVDVGGATTDVYSLATGAPTRDSVHTMGLREPFAKRTVEGDLGLFHNLDTLSGLAGESDANDGRAQELRTTFSVPEGDAMQEYQLMLSNLAVKTAVGRHVGRIEAVPTHNGDVWVQRGKDLSDIKTVIGGGGPLAFSSDPLRVLRGVLAEPSEPDLLKPKSPEFYLDARYILFAVGLLAQTEPDIALRIIKKNLKKIG